MEYNGTSKKCKYKCLDCERVYEKARASHLYENKTLCQKCCSPKNSEIKDNFIKKIDDNNNFELVGKITNTNVPVDIKCLKCGREIKIFMYNFIKKENYSCRFCGKNGGEKDIIEFKKRMQTVEKDKEYELVEYKNMTTSALFKHKKCGFIYRQNPANFLNGRGCPKCYRNKSKGEQKIEKFLIEKNIKFEEQKAFKELGGKSFDFFLPDFSIAIEYQGEQHYHPLQCFGGEEKFIAQQKRDEEKREFCKNNNYKLIEIPYNEDINHYFNLLEGSTTSLYDVGSSEPKEDCK